MATVRYFAAAAEAAGRLEERLDGTTVGDLRAAMVARYGTGFESLLRRCAVLVGGVRAPEAAPVGDHDVVDVLPPFAGG